MTTIRNNDKDGGYGWVIVGTSFAVQFIALGVYSAFGLFFIEISTEFSQIGKGGTSWVPSIMIAAAHAIGPVGSMLVNKYGLRRVSILGSVLATAGFSISYFAQSAAVLYCTLGIAGGIGTGLLYLPAMVSVPRHFDKKLALATGICVSGSGVGTLFFEWAFDLILTNFTWREGLLMTAGVFVLSIPLGLLYPPFVAPAATEARLDQQQIDGETKELLPGNRKASETDPEIMWDDEKSVAPKKRNLIDLLLLKNILFILFSTADLLTSFAFNIPQVYLPDIEKTMTNAASNSLLGFIAVPMIFSRLILGYLSDKNWVNRFVLYTVALLVTGIVTAISPQLDTIGLLRLYCAIFGICIGIYLGLKSVILVDLVGTEKLTDAFGLLLLVQAIGMFLGAPVAGYFYDFFGNYKGGFYFAGGMFILSSSVLAFIPYTQEKLNEINSSSSSNKDFSITTGYSTFTTQNDNVITNAHQTET